MWAWGSTQPYISPVVGGSFGGDIKIKKSGGGGGC
jgi:hypothetical protein